MVTSTSKDESQPGIVGTWVSGPKTLSFSEDRTADLEIAYLDPTRKSDGYSDPHSYKTFRGTYAFLSPGNARISLLDGSSEWEVRLSPGELTLLQPGEPDTKFRRREDLERERKSQENEKRTREVAMIVSGQKAGNTYESGSLLIEQVEALAKQEKFSEVERLLPKIEELPDSALIQPAPENGQGMFLQLNLTRDMDNAARILDEHRQYALSERLLQRAVSGNHTIAGDAYGLEQRGDLSKHLARVRAAQGKYDQAASDLQQVLNTQGPKRSVLSQQGSVYLSQKRYAEAERTFKQMYESTSDDTSHNYNSWPIEALRGIGKAQYLQGKYADSCSTYGEVLNRLKQGEWQRDAYIAQDFNNYAKVLRKLGRDGAARDVEADREKLPPMPQQFMSTYSDQHKYDLD